MKKLSDIPLTSGKAFAALALTATLAAAPGAFAQFTPTGAGPYDYNDTANWNGGTINNQFTANPTANQTVTFGADTTLSSTWTINNTGTFNHTFTGSGAARTVTLGGNLSLGNSANANKMTIGSATPASALNIDLGSASREITVGTNRSLEILNVISSISGNRGFTKRGLGTLTLSGTANTYTGATAIGGGTTNMAGGVLEVTKLANGGQASSIGASSNATSNLIFGGPSGSPAGTLRYIGTGDSTDRLFSVGSLGAAFDASGSGAIAFTNAGNINWISPTVNRTITFTGENTDNNSMAARLIDPTQSGTTASITSISKTGSGKWILTGSNTYSGATTVSAGTLVINGSIANSTTTVNGGLLGGSGTTGAVIVNDAGAVGAGNSIGTLRTGDLTLNDSAEFVFEFNITSPGVVTADLIIANAFNLDTDNTAVLTLSNLGLNVALDPGTILTLVDYSGAWNNGTFAGLADDSSFTFGANTFTISYNGVSGADSAVTLEVVPEPSTVALIGLGLTAVLFRARRRVG